MSALLFCVDYEDVVYLNNGSVIRGTVIEIQPEELVKVQTSDGSIFVYKMEEVERIAKERAYKDTQSKRKFVSMDTTCRMLRAGVMTSGSVYYEGDKIGDVPNPSFAGGLSFTRGLTDNIAMGLGFEYNNYENGGTVPIYLAWRAITNEESFLHLVANTGYQFGWITNNGGNASGLFLDFGIGIHSRSLLLEFTYRMIWSKLYYYTDFNEGSFDIRYGYITFMFGTYF